MGNNLKAWGNLMFFLTCSCKSRAYAMLVNLRLCVTAAQNVCGSLQTEKYLFGWRRLIVPNLTCSISFETAGLRCTQFSTDDGDLTGLAVCS